jgi:hypothetical protein
MRSKRTSRYRHQFDEDDDIDDFMKMLSSSAKDDEESKEIVKTNTKTVGMSLSDRVLLFLLERSGDLVLPYLDKHDRTKMSFGKTVKL